MPTGGVVQLVVELTFAASTCYATGDCNRHHRLRKDIHSGCSKREQKCLQYQKKGINSA